MTLKTRRILYILFISAFFLVTPLVIIFATGYSFSFSERQIFKTGILSLRTEPEGAKIYIDEKPLINILKQANWKRQQKKLKKLSNAIPEIFTPGRIRTG